MSYYGVKVMCAELLFYIKWPPMTLVDNSD